MRKIISSLTLCLFWIIPIASQTTSDTHRAQLIGPVKSVEFYLVGFAVKNGANVEESRRTVRSTTYNTQGRILEDVSYDQYGAISQKLVYTYDSEGRGTGYNEYAALLDKSLTIPRRHVYGLDDKGRRAEYTVFESTGSVGSRFVYKYDVNGNLSEEEWYAHTGQLGGKTVSTFDEKGNQTSQAYYGGDGSLSWRNASKYDSSGNRTELLQYHGDTFRYKIISSYDKKGRILENETFEFNGIPGLYSSHAPKPGKVVYTYNDEKRTKEVATYEVGGVLKERVVYTYDERENEIGLTSFNEPRTVANDSVSRSLINIDYDSHGNWTMKTRMRQSHKSEPPQPDIAELRVITYY
jgi:hypothetical protein